MTKGDCANIVRLGVAVAEESEGVVLETAAETPAEADDFRVALASRAVSYFDVMLKQL